MGILFPALTSHTLFFIYLVILLPLTISQIPSLLSGLDVPLPHPFHHHTPGHRDNSSSLTLLDIPSVTSPSRDSTTVEPDLQSFRPQSNDQSFSSSLTNPFTMAGLKNIILAASLLAPLTMAAPRLDVRAMYTHTDTEIVWVTVEETTTVWLDAASATPAPVAATTSSSSSSTISTIPVAVDSSTTSAAAVFAQTSYSPSTMATVAAVSSAAYSPAAAAWSSSAAPVASSSASAAASPAASASSVNVQAKDISASNSASCEGQGAACEGDVTHWDGGLGACGWTVNTGSDMAIALPYAFMGTQSNGNPYCGRSVTLYNPTSGTTVQATVGDKCMGCVDRAIDCTDALFNAITDGTGDGRVSGIEWWLN